MLYVTDMNRENPFTVERALDVPAMDAPPELLAQEMERIGAHQAPTRTYYRELKAKFARPFRANLVDARTAELGAEIRD